MAFFPVQANRFFFYSLQKKLNELFCSGLNRLFFGNSFKFTGKLRKRYRNFPYSFYPPPHIHSLPIINVPHQMVCLLQLMNLQGLIIVIQSPQFSLAFIWWCTLYGFGQRYNDMYPSLQYHTEYFHCPRNLYFVSSFLVSMLVTQSE